MTSQYFFNENLKIIFKFSELPVQQIFFFLLFCNQMFVKEKENLELKLIQTAGNKG